MAYTQAAEKLWNDGFAVIENFLTSAEIKSLKDRMHTIVDEVDPKQHQTVFSSTNQARNNYFMNSADNISFFFEEGALDSEGNLKVEKDVSINKIGHALHCQDPVFSNVTQSDKIKELVKAIGFKDPVIFQSMYIFKPPKIGGAVKPHQDSTFLDTRPKRLVGVWIPLEDATKENGCLWFQPGSHKNGVHNDYYMIRNVDKGDTENNLTFTAECPSYDGDFVPAEVKAGSLVLIHGEVVHKSAANTSSKSRHAYTFHLYDSFETIYSDRNWLQPTDKGTFTHLFS